MPERAVVYETRVSQSREDGYCTVRVAVKPPLPADLVGAIGNRAESLMKGKPSGMDAIHEASVMVFSHDHCKTGNHPNALGAAAHTAVRAAMKEAKLELR